MKLPAYPRTKPSGVEWLGDVPEHWDTRKFSREVMIAEGQVDPEKEPYLSMMLVGPEHVESGTGRLLAKVTAVEQAAQSGKYYCRQGDVVYSKIRPALRKLVIAPEDCLCSADMYPLRARERFQNEFIYWLFLSQSFAAWSVLESDRVAMPKINRDTLNELRMPVPPLAEQRSIAAFLDRETGRVDRLVAKKRELIERLKEKRTALISRTVTRGLPPAAARAAGLPANPPLKPSTLDWLGDIPAHWNIVPLRYAFYNLDHRRIPVAGEDRATVEKIYPYYGASGIIDHVEDYLFDETLILVAEDGANLLSRSTPLAFLATGKYWVNNHAHILKPVEGDIRYWAAVLQTYDYTPLVTGAAQPKLTSDRLGSIRLPMPPPDEQAAIAAYLDEETAKLDALVGKVEEAVERLQEYRTALITAAVTGKIDVREGVAP